MATIELVGVTLLGALCDCGEIWDTNDMHPPEGH